MRHKTGILFSVKDSEQIRILLAEKARAAEQDKIDRRNRRLQKQDIIFLVLLGLLVAGALVLVFARFFQQHQ